MLLSLPTRQIEVAARRDALLTLAVLLAVMAATMAAVFAGGNRLLLQPVMRLASTAAKLKGGETGARTGLPHGDDEIGRLAAALDESAAAIEERERRLEDKS